MNYETYVTIVVWQTKNSRHQHKAEQWCKNYGLQPLQRSMYGGPLYSKERLQLVSKLERLLIKAREQISCFVICKSCLKSATIKDMSETLFLKQNDYELIQIPQNP